MDKKDNMPTEIQAVLKRAMATAVEREARGEYADASPVDAMAEARRVAERWGCEPRQLDAVCGASFDRSTQAVVAVSGWMRNKMKKEKKNILVLSGGNGCGKTVAATAFLVEMALGHTTSRIPAVCFITAAEAQLRLFEDKAHLRIALSSSPYLVVDDLSGEHEGSSEYFSCFLSYIIDKRYSRYLPTILTTNLNSKDFVSRYGERTTDRLRDAGVFCEIDAASMRRRKVK